MATNPKRPKTPLWLRYLEGNHPPLTKGEEHELIRRFQEKNDQRALERLIMANARFVISFTKKRYQRSGIPLEDLIHEGFLGLMEAAKRFDLSKDLRFISYAVWWVRQMTEIAVAEQTGFFNLPIKVVNLIVKYMKLRAEERETGLFLTSRERAERLKITLNRLEGIEAVLGNQISINAPMTPDNSIQFGDSLSQSEDSCTGDEAVTRILLMEIRETFSKLNDNERDVLALRFGLGGGKPLNMAEIGRRLGFSRERVRQIEKSGLNKIRGLFLRKTIARSLN
ncbi:MAG TPA: sigma-70 family RNA polymerase sigma factor [Candidatus Aminicenantes bacterium]|nr:sigma-70 family RNA polymerase sigma factor [Candidatus Aminicenantes bacterium]HPB54440.1 sigma-70 family RNA polymerase sigma factor [Candidatus Aminicenantes bacterium]HPT00409.1 sigma-70 family RNA polymerase sigma factor [Candidatus Aminicenantes bacterium]